MRRLFKLLGQLIAIAFLLVAGLTAYVIFDGLKDEGMKADAGLVVEDDAPPSAKAEQPGLERAANLYRDGAFPVIIICPVQNTGITQDVRSSTHYLEKHGVPANAVLTAKPAPNTPDAAREIADIMKKRGFMSIMVIADYYRETRAKLTLYNEGVAEIHQAHVGEFRREDVVQIGQEIFDLCKYVGRVYLLPAAKKAKEEAKVGLDKASVEAEKAKQKVNKSFDDLVK